LKRFAEARAEFETALKLDPTFAVAQDELNKLPRG